jgi:hypothetical protein
MDYHRLELGETDLARPYLSLSFPGASSSRPAPGEPRALLSLRSAGSMRYLGGHDNPDRERFFRSLGLGPGRLVATELHHTRRLRFIEDSLAGLASGTPVAYELEAAALAGEDFGDGGPDGVPGRDGLVIWPGPSGLVPVVTVADCMPIWLLDRHSGAYGVLHSGWKGTGILEAAVRGLVARHASPPSAIALILGPAIGGCCYAVPPERAAYFRREFGASAVIEEAGTFRLDLRRANRDLAEKLGIGALLSVDNCTACSPGLGSYRREGPKNFTRMAAACGHFDLPS